MILRPLVKCMDVFVCFQVNPDYRDENVDTKSEVRTFEVGVMHLSRLDFSFVSIHSIIRY